MPRQINNPSIMFRTHILRFHEKLDLEMRRKGLRAWRLFFSLKSTQKKREEALKILKDSITETMQKDDDMLLLQGVLKVCELRAQAEGWFFKPYFKDLTNIIQRCNTGTLYMTTRNEIYIINNEVNPLKEIRETLSKLFVQVSTLSVKVGTIKTQIEEVEKTVQKLQMEHTDTREMLTMLFSSQSPSGSPKSPPGSPDHGEQQLPGLAIKLDRKRAKNSPSPESPLSDDSYAHVPLFKPS